MKWIEIIELRSTAGGWDQEDNDFMASLKDIKKENGLNEIQFYRHCALDTDFKIHLHWESDNAEQGGSPLGQQLVQALKEFGLVNHSVWIEEMAK